MLFKGKNKSTETVPEKDLLANILNNNIKTTALKMVTELMEDVGKVKEKKSVNKRNINQ